MSVTLPSHSKIQISPTGLDVLSPLTFEEWSGVALSLGVAARSIAFVIGDWLVYGEANFRKGPAASRVATEVYDAAIRATGLDRTTLQNYAYVSRRLIHANANNDPAIIAELRGLMGEIREAWATIQPPVDASVSRMAA